MPRIEAQLRWRAPILAPHRASKTLRPAADHRQVRLAQRHRTVGLSRPAGYRSRRRHWQPARGMPYIFIGGPEKAMAWWNSRHQSSVSLCGSPLSWPSR